MSLHRSLNDPHRADRPSSVRYLGFRVLSLVLLLASPVLAADVAPDTLVIVNGDAVTSADMDQQIIEAHASMDMGQQSGVDLRRLLEKQVNDRLILQDAQGMGLAEEPEVAADLVTKRVERAIRNYVSDAYEPVTEADADSMGAFFERYYWRIELRQVSCREEATTREMRDAVLAGADMDSLAREVSLDTRAAKGGLHNLKYWADVENRLRDASRGVPVGGVSDVFPFNEAFAFVRVEQLLPLDEADFARFETKIKGAVREAQNNAAWSDFLARCVAQVDLQENIEGFAAIIADSSRVLSEGFLREQPEAVITVTGGPEVNGTELRKAVSKQFMKAATTPFPGLFVKARLELSRRAALEHLARTNGYYDTPELEAAFARDLNQEIIQAYLNEIIVPKIVFNRDEFDGFYRENADQFRGAEEVRLDFLILHEKEQADDAAARLAAGADFDFIREQISPAQAEGKTESRFAKITMLSQAIRDELEGMQVGEASGLVEMPMGWMIFRLDQRREGSVAPMAEVEMTIREVMFQRKFNERLEEHLDLLKERSQIDRRDAAIKAYFNPGEEG